jgi:hypothetical protein
MLSRHPRAARLWILIRVLDLRNKIVPVLRIRTEIIGPRFFQQESTKSLLEVARQDILHLGPEKGVQDVEIEI